MGSIHCHPAVLALWETAEKTKDPNILQQVFIDLEALDLEVVGTSGVLEAKLYVDGKMRNPNNYPD